MEFRVEETLLEIYRRLRSHFGLRGWWPGETAFEVVVGCILTQNTNWVNVEKAIANLRGEGLLQPKALSEAAHEDIIRLAKPTGFFTQKPARLKRLTEWWLNKAGDDKRTLLHYKESAWGESGQLRIAAPFSQEVNWREERNELLALSGVGPETADAILLYAAGRPTFVVDAYTRRVFSRLGLVSDKVTYNNLRALFQNNLPPDVPLFNDFHAQITQLAKVHCRTKPICSGCPLADVCEVGKREAG